MTGQAQVPAPLVAGAGVLQLILIGVVLDTRRIAVPGPAPHREPPDLGFVPADLLARVGALEAAAAARDAAVAQLAKDSTATDARVLLLEQARQDDDEEEAAARRQMQSAEPEPEHGEFVLQIKRNVTRCGGPGAGNIGGHFDMSRCADHTFQQCHREECIGYNGDHSHGKGGGKHRRAQASGACNLPLRTDALNAACCQAPEDCAGGGPQTCTDACAGQLLPFWKECGPVLGQDTVEVLGPVVRPNGFVQLREVLCERPKPSACWEHRWRCASASPRSPSSSTSGARTAHRPLIASRNATKISTARSSS